MTLCRSQLLCLMMDAKYGSGKVGRRESEVELVEEVHLTNNPMDDTSYCGSLV